MISPDPKQALPLVRCADDYFRIFGKPWEGTKMLKSFGLAIALMLVFPFAEFALKPIGLKWLLAPLVLGGGLVVVWKHYCKPHPRPAALPGDAPGPAVSRFDYFKTLPCPHCGKAVGSTFSKQMILHLHCNHCGGEAKTDCMFMAGGTEPVKV